MTDWGSGYVTDIPYMTGYYRQQSPSLIALACLLNGVASPMPDPDAPIHYLELGCGQGFGATLLAASNPHWRVTAIDFNPAHIASARATAAAMALQNVQFLEADLSSFAEDAAAAALPDVDFVSMHGLWSWVPASVQAGIVRLLRLKVKPGGAVHLSYNALPAWGAALGLQRVMREAGLRLGTRSDRQAEEGLKLVKALLDADALQFAQSAFTRSLIGRMGTLPNQYLAHEYMNNAWAPCFMSDVANALADAKLEWVGSAQLAENFTALMLTEEQRALVQRFDEPLMRELIKDICLERSLRHDVFVRGARRLSTPMRDAALMDVGLAINIRPEDMPFEAEMPAGRAALNESFYRPIIEALTQGPRRVGDLLALPSLEGKRDNPAELIGMLIGLDFAEPALHLSRAPSPEAARFNRVITTNMMRTENLGRPIAAASALLGTGAPCSLFDLYVVHRLRDGDTIEQIDDWVGDIGANADEEARGKLRHVLQKCAQERLPILLAQGVC